MSADQVVSRSLHVFCDASEQAIAAVAFLRTVDRHGVAHVSLVIGKAKLAPKSATTIPRLELCAAVLGAEICDVIKHEMELTIDQFYFYSDSQAVLGYLSKTSRRFFIYVSNQVALILASSYVE